MQYWLEGKHTREQVIGVMKAAVARAMDEQLEKYKDQWKWLPDANGNRTWEIEPPVSKLRPEDRPTTLPSSGPFRPTTPEQAPAPGRPPPARR